MDPAICLSLHYLRRQVLAARTTGRVVIEFSDGEPFKDVHGARVLSDENGRRW